MNIKILVCCHNQCELPSDESYLNLHVGAALSPLNLNIQKDNEGDNISFKNGNYCELTGLYWAWKNLNCDYIGLCHYRRLFDFNNCKSVNREPIHTGFNDFPSIQISNIKKILEKSDIILPGKLYLNMSVGNAYSVSHSGIDLKITETVLKELYPDYWQSYNHIMNCNNSYSPCNMFVTSKKVFDNYCEWLFNILFEVEKRVCLNSYDKHQQRIFGFLSERLFNVYINHHNLKITYRPIISMIEKKNASRIYEIAHRIKCNICFWLQKK